MLPCASVMVGTTSSGKVAGRSGRQSDPRANLMAVEVADAMESEVCQFPQARPPPLRQKLLLIASSAGACPSIARTLPSCFRKRRAYGEQIYYLRGCQAERHKSDGRPRD
jgi:hypothetical protein